MVNPLFFALVSYFFWAIGDIFGTVATRKLGGFSTTVYSLALRLIIFSLYLPFAISYFKYLTIDLFLIIVARLFYWQVVKASELSDLGVSQYGAAISLLPARGEIKTSDKFPIAANKNSYLVFANPKEVKDKKATSQALSEILKIESASISANLSKDLLEIFFDYYIK